MYNENIYCNYIRRYIITINIFIIHEVYFCYTRRCIIKYLLSLYKRMYNENKYFYYT